MNTSISPTPEETQNPMLNLMINPAPTITPTNPITSPIISPTLNPTPAPTLSPRPTPSAIDISVCFKNPAIYNQMMSQMNTLSMKLARAPNVYSYFENASTHADFSHLVSTMEQVTPCEASCIADLLLGDKCSTLLNEINSINVNRVVNIIDMYQDVFTRLSTYLFNNYEYIIKQCHDDPQKVEKLRRIINQFGNIVYPSQFYANLWFGCACVLLMIVIFLLYTRK